MPKRVKEEEKTEKIIRALLKLPENRKCMNCNVLVRQTFSFTEILIIFVVFIVSWFNNSTTAAAFRWLY